MGIAKIWRYAVAVPILMNVIGCGVKGSAPQLSSIRPAAEPVQEGAPLGRWIRVEKLERRLTVFDDTNPIREYPIVLGASPVGAKLYEGDNKTPEGEYRISAKYPHDAWSRFMLLDYPTPMNRYIYEWTRRSGLLPQRGSRGPGIGGQVGIHGTVSDLINQRGDDWTRGCISLRNGDVEELFTLVDVGTRVVIEK